MFLMGLSLTYIWKRYGKETLFILMTMASLMPNAVVYNMEVRLYLLGKSIRIVSYGLM